MQSRVAVLQGSQRTHTHKHTHAGDFGQGGGFLADAEPAGPAVVLGELQVELAGLRTPSVDMPLCMHYQH
eukprot:scaffold32660_cov19-Tisochrysis_lutea.AAC.1